MHASLARRKFSSGVGKREITICKGKNIFATEVRAKWRNGFGAKNIDFARRQAIIESMETRCARCNSPMTCQPEANCWCKELPALPMPKENSGCLCRECLKNELEARDAAINEQN